MSVAVVRRNAWVIGAAVLSLVLTVQPFRDSDVWWHLAIGHYILAHGIPAVEPFSFLHAANPWVGQQWLYEVTPRAPRRPRRPRARVARSWAWWPRRRCCWRRCRSRRSAARPGR